MADIKLQIFKKDKSIYEVNKRKGLKNIDSLSQSSADAKSISYGTIANTGSSEVIDVNNEIYEMIINKEIDNNKSPINIVVNNNIIQKHIINNIDYTNDKVSSLELSNTLSKWEKLIYSGRKLTPAISAYDLLVEVLISFGCDSSEISEMLSNKIYIDEYSYDTIENYLKLINIKYPYLKEGTYKETIDKICQIAQLVVFEDNNGKIKFDSARPFKVYGDDVINIYKKHQFSKFNYSIIQKNKFDKVIINKNKFVLNDLSLVKSLNVIVYDDNSNFVGTDIENINKEFKDVGLIVDGTTQTESDASISTNTVMTLNIPNLSPKFIDDTIQVKITKTYSGGSSETYVLPKYEAFTPIVAGSDFYNSGYTHDGLSLKFNFTIAFKWASIWGGLISKQKVSSFTIDIYAKTYEFEETEILYGEGNNKINFTSNELFNDETTYNNVPIYELFANNILNDYSNGISSGSLKVGCVDYYNIEGNKIKDWSKGEIINVGDVVKVEGNDKLWEVTGRNFTYVGVPLIDLELRQIKPLDKYKIIIPEDTNNIINIKVVDANTGIIYKNGDEVEEGTKIIVNVEQANIHNPIRVNHIYYKDTSDLQSYAVEISNGETILIKSDIKFIIDYSFAVVYFSPENDWDGYGIYVTESDIIDNHLSIFSTYNPFGYDLYNEVSIVIREGSSTFGSTDATFSADMLNNIGNNFVSGIFDVDGYLFNIQINKTNCIIDSTKYSNLIGKLIVVEYYYWRSVIIGF